MSEFWFLSSVRVNPGAQQAFDRGMADHTEDSDNSNSVQHCDMILTLQMVDSNISHLLGNTDMCVLTIVFIYWFYIQWLAGTFVVKQVYNWCENASSIIMQGNAY